MDPLKRTWQQFADLFGALPPSQRLTLVAVPAVLAAAFGVLIWQGKSSSETPLSWGKVFAVDELRTAEQTLIEAGLSDFRTEGQRIYVPTAEVEKYNAALLVDGRLPSESLSEFERQFEKSNVFTSREQLAVMKEIALQNEVRKVLRALPDIEDARVTWARSEARRWVDRPGRVTATVSLRPRRGRPLSPSVVRSVRSAVGSMIPDLAPDDVTVFDQSTATAFTADRDAPFDGELVRWIDQHTEHYRRRIAGALAYIPDASVSVSVDVENLKSQIVREQLVDAKKTAPVETEERTRSTTTTERATAAEPGATSNVPRQLQTTAAPTRSATSSESDNNSRVVPSFTVTEKEFLTAMPKAVQVSVSIPESYYRDVALARGFAEGTTDPEKAAFRTQLDTIRTEEEGKVRKQAMTLIPAGSPEAAVTVTSVTHLDLTPPAVVVPMTERVSDFLRTWGGTLGLGLLAAWGLRTLGRSMPRPPPLPAEPLSAVASAEAEEDVPAGPPPTPRDLLQGYVRDNPEAAAAVIGRWIQAAK